MLEKKDLKSLLKNGRKREYIYGRHYLKGLMQIKYIILMTEKKYRQNRQRNTEPNLKGVYFSLKMLFGHVIKRS